MPKIAIIANARSGGGTWVALERLIQGRASMRVYLLESKPVEVLVQQAWDHGCQTMVAAGGDGTVSAVANAILTLGVPARLGVLPIGTLNHFAKDLHIPLDRAQALDILEQGHSVEVDAAKVNDRYFINNSSIGLYPLFVKARLQLEARGLHKWVAFVLVLLSAGMRRFVFTIEFGKGETVPKKTSSIFIGNNKYALEGFAIGERSALNQGLLTVAVLKSLHSLQLVRLVYKAFFGAVLQDSDINVTGLQSCTINGKNKKILVSYDGEVAHMQLPLNYSIVPKALKVLVPVT